jgi:hypothetical protein
MDATVFGAWVATGLTLFIFSFLYKDNPLFKLAEHLYVGVSVGYTIVKAYDTVIVHLIVKPIFEQGEIALLVPVAIGMLMLTRYVPKAAWLSRYAFAFIVGVGSGLAIPRTISSFILKQIEDTVRPVMVVPFNQAFSILSSSRAAFAFLLILTLAATVVGIYLLVRLGFNKLSGALQLAIGATTSLLIAVLFKLRVLARSWDSMAEVLHPIGEVFDVNSLVVLLGVSCVLFYFFFSVEHTGPGKAAARTGILFLMVSFGAAFGYTVMARMSLLIGRLTDLIEFSDTSYGRPTLWLLILTVGALVVLSRRTLQSEPPESY